MQVKTHYLPHLYPWQKACKKIQATMKNLYDDLFDVHIAIKDVKSMHPKVNHFTARRVAKILFKQSLRDDFPKSQDAMIKKLDKNPYMRGLLMYYDPKKQMLYKYHFNNTRRNYASVQEIIHKMLHNNDYMNFCQKVSYKLNQQLAK